MTAHKYLEVLRNSNLCFWTDTIFLSLRKEEVNGIFIRTGIDGSRQNLWEPTMEKNIWNSNSRIILATKFVHMKALTGMRMLQILIIIQIHLSSFT